MKHSFDFGDRVFDILQNAGFDDEITGDIIVDPSSPVEGETVLINVLNVDSGADVVDNANVTVNLLIPDMEGATDNQRFRFLIPKLTNILLNYKDYEGDFVQYKRNNAGTGETDQVTPTDEFFHINPIFSHGIEHDPERQGYSFFSVRLSCWIEK